MMKEINITGGNGNPLSLKIKLMGKSTKETSSSIGESLTQLENKINN